MKSAKKTADNPATGFQSGKFQLLIGYYHLRLALLWQSFFAQTFVKEITALSATLSKDVFPALLELRQDTLIASPIPEQTGLLLTDKNNHPLGEIVKSPLLASFLTDLKISQLTLDPRLESYQIKNALTILFHTGKGLGQIPARKDRITTALLSNAGLEAFCCNIRVDLAQKSIGITYFYCELFYSFTVKTILQRYTRSKNHQAIFSLAPKFGFFIGLLFLLHHLFWAPFSLAGVIAASLGAIGLGSGIAYLLNTLASTINDLEYRDKLLKENTRELKALSYLAGADITRTKNLEHELSSLNMKLKEDFINIHKNHSPNA